MNSWNRSIRNLGQANSLKGFVGFLRRIRNSIVCITITSVAATGNPAYSQVQEELYFGDVPVVLSVTRLKQSLSNTPASVTIIDKEMIRASGAMNIPDLLRHVPGFQVAFVTGKRATVTAHGRGDEYARDMQITIDGRSIYDPAYGGVPWQDLQIDVDDIERIEVIRGPNAASHGSNSFAGVVNITTEHPTQQQGVLLKTRFGTGENSKNYGRFAGSLGNLDFRIGVSETKDDGFDSRVDSERTDTITFRGDLRLSSKDNLFIALGQSNGPREEGFAGSIEQPLRTADHINEYQQLRWSRQISPEEELRIQFYHNYQKKDDHFESAVPGLGVLAMGFGFDSHRYDAELEYTKRFNDNFRLVAGFGSRYESAEGIWTLGENRPNRRQYRVFSNAEWTVQPNTVLNIGGMYEAYSGKSGLFSPRLAINHRVDAASTLRAVASRAYRMPTLFEDNSRLIIYNAADGTPVDYFFLTLDDLEPEVIDAFEVGFLSKFPAHGMTLDFRLFNEKIKNVIPNIDDQRITGPMPIPPLDGAQSYVNHGNITISGAEVDLKYRPVPRSLIHVGYSVANVRGEQLRRIKADGARRFLDLDESVPKQTFSLLGSYRFENGIEISSAFHYVDPMEWLYDGNFVPERTRLDFRIARRFRTSRAEIDLEFIAQNIDGDDVEFYNDPDDADEPVVNIADERFFLRARVHFH